MGPLMREINRDFYRRVKDLIEKNGATFRTVRKVKALAKREKRWSERKFKALIRILCENESFRRKVHEFHEREFRKKLRSPSSLEGAGWT